MKISHQWIKDYLEFDLDVDETSEILTNLGLEVEGVEAFESVKGGFEGIVVGHVLSCEQHPNADRLKVTQVDIGEQEPVQIVCGAPNVAKGQKVVVAKVNTTLHTNAGESFKIKKSKIRGELSQGMICAEDEIGIGEDHDGIMVLDSSLTAGTPCSEVFEITKDNVYEIG
ncbi:MAG: YtpR family tRNA-binding protein, partial [Flavobacteriaceae bacterium]